MSHKSIHKDLIFYLDNELPEQRKVTIEKHLEECTDCQRFLAFLKEELEMVAKEKNPEVSPFFYTRLSARFEEKPLYSRQRRWANMLEPAFFSLLLVVAIYAGLWLGSQASALSPQPHEMVNLQLLNDFEAEPIESFLLK